MALGNFVKGCRAPGSEHREEWGIRQTRRWQKEVGFMQTVLGIECRGLNFKSQDRDESSEDMFFGEEAVNIVCARLFDLYITCWL